MMMKSTMLLLALTGLSNAKEEKIWITMRDGFNLSTYINCEFELGQKEKTIIFEASPYGHDQLETIALYIADALGTDYCSVRQDMRGSGLSQGQDFTLWRSQGNDTQDTFNWLSAQEWSNGEIYQTGASADGLAAMFGNMHKPPQLKKQLIVWASIDTHTFSYPGGAYREGLQDGWLRTSFPHQWERLRETSRQHEAPGAWWNPVNGTGHCELWDFPSVHLAGWYDIFLNGNIEAYHCYKNGNPFSTHLVVEACGHCLVDGFCPIYEDLDVDAIPLALLMALDLFHGNPIPEEINLVTFRVMGAGDRDGKFIDPFAPGNYWTTLPAFPVPELTPVYFKADGKLAYFADGVETPMEYTYDPAHPVKTIGGNNLELKCGALDQRPVENRTDVLVFTSEVLDVPVAITGNLTAKLFVKSNRVDTDFTVKLTDVYPDGRSLLINDGIIRMRWRAGEGGGSEPQMMTPGQVYEVDVSLWQTSFIFAPGHKIRVSVSSSNSPRFEPNPNNGLPLVQNGTVYTADNTVLVGGEHASHFILPVVTQDQIPPIDMEALQEKWLSERPASWRNLGKLDKKYKQAMINAAKGL